VAATSATGSGNGSPRELPEIRITTRENEVNDQAIEALANVQNIYRLGYVLATVVEEPDPPRGVAYVDGPPPHISPLEPAKLRERMAGAARWVAPKLKGDEWESIPAHPPDWSVAAVHKRQVYPGIRPIVGVIEAPTMRRDGSILSEPGYDPATRLCLKPNVVVAPVAARPSLADAQQALEEIYDLVTDFPFNSGERKAVWLASLFTVVARASFSGPAPLFGLDGNVPGSGKSKLADLVAVIPSGRRMPRSVWPSGRLADEEMRKRITSMAMAGERFALLGVPVGEALRLLREDNTALLYPTLRAALAELTDKTDLPCAKSVGRHLKGMQGRTVGIYVLRRVELRSNRS